MSDDRMAEIRASACLLFVGTAVYPEVPSALGTAAATSP